MRQETCVGCGLTANVQSFYGFQGKSYCEPCVWKVSSEAKGQGKPSEYVSLKDNTICARCGADNGSADFPLLANKPLCLQCGGLVSDWPYPQWLKVSLAFLLVLLAIALVSGKKYFRAGSDLYKGERLVNEGKYGAAVHYLQRTVSLAPESDKGVLLLAKAALLTGNVAVANKALEGHEGGHFKDADNSDFREVDALWNRAIKGMEEADKASKLASQDGKAAEAASLMHDAARLYPEFPGFAFAAEVYDEGAAFESKQYDQFLAITQKLWQEAPNSETAASVASALACKYAVTGDVQFRNQAEQMLTKAQQLAAGDRETQKNYNEYSERINYRLKSREIINTAEFSRRFRANAEKD